MSNKKTPFIRQSVSLDSQTYDLLTGFAEKKKLSKSSIIRLLIIENLGKKINVT